MNVQKELTLCPDRDCPLRHGCARFLVALHPESKMFAESPRQGDKCEKFFDYQRFKKIEHAIKATMRALTPVKKRPQYDHKRH